MIKVLGTTDEVTACDCCGKKDLKGTVALSFDDADPVYFGVVCASKASGWNAKELRAAARKADDAAAREREAALYAARKVEDDKFQAFLDVAAPGHLDYSGRPSRFAQLQVLGGFAAARALYHERSSS